MNALIEMWLSELCDIKLENRNIKKFKTVCEDEGKRMKTICLTHSVRMIQSLTLYCYR